MKKRNILILFAGLLLMVGSAIAQDVAGEWEMTTTGGRAGRGGGGGGAQTFTIVQDGEKITVTMAGRMGEMTGEGTIKENKIEWTFTMETPRGNMEMSYTGTVDGDSMSGKSMRGMGENAREVEWTAKKK
jgi:hypothetical protein